jgi:uncharacterized protein GlcG (DUF336 family)
MIFPDDRLDVRRTIQAVLDEFTASLTPAAPPALLLEDALRMGRGVYAEAQRLNVAIVFCVVDAGGTPLVLHRMDNAFLGSVEFARAKAWTAAAFQRPTHAFFEACQPGRELYGVQHAPGVTIVGGGYPCFRDKTLVGGVGVSGGTLEQDMALASRALEFL